MNKDSHLIFEAYSNSLLTEMPQINLQGKQVIANNQPLKGLKLVDVKENIVIFRQPTAGIVPAGYTLAYFMDSAESAEKMKRGEIDYLIIPDRTRYMRQAPITDVWKKKRDTQGQEHILGIIQGRTNEKEIYVDKMSVRAPFRRNSINSQLINALKERFPNAKVNFSGPTRQGSRFIRKYTGKSWEPAHGERAEY